MIARRVSILLVVSALLLCTVALADDAVISRIRRERVVSSNVASIGYSRHLHALEVEFTRGAIYRFLSVPPIVYRELMASDSKGHFIADRLRGKYQFVHVRSSNKLSRDRTVAHN